jgi:hypothetical protein
MRFPVCSLSVTLSVLASRCRRWCCEEAVSDNRRDLASDFGSDLASTRGPVCVCMCVTVCFCVEGWGRGEAERGMEMQERTKIKGVQGGAGWCLRVFLSA